MCAKRLADAHPEWSRKYHQMAEDELRHAEYLHSMAEASGEAMTELEQIMMDDLREMYHDKLAHVRGML